MEPAIDAQQAVALDFDNLPVAYFVNPHGYLKALRTWDPMHRNADGSILLTRYVDVAHVWRDISCAVDKQEIFAHRFGAGPLLEHHTSTMLFRDPPDHDRLRQTVNHLFRPDRLARFEQLIEGFVGDLIAFARAKREIEFVSEIAYPVTTQLICRMLGLPVEDGAWIAGRARMVALPLNTDADAATIADGHRAGGELKAYLAEKIAMARGGKLPDVGGSVIEAMVDAEANDACISAVEMQHMLVLMFNGGYESTANFLSLSMMGLVDDPFSMDQMRQPDIRIGSAIEELVRFTTPLQLQGRRLTKPVTLSAGELPEGTEIVLSVASANWDETIFANPERIDFQRGAKRHLGFGGGIHICIGKQLAKMQAAKLLPAFTRAFGTIERASVSTYRETPRFRGVDRLALRVES